MTHRIYTNPQYIGFLVQGSQPHRDKHYHFRTLTEACRFARKQLGCIHFERIGTDEYLGFTA